MKLFSRQFISILWGRVTTSIAFYPSLIAFLFTILAVGILKWEDNDVTQFLIDKLPFLVINNDDTARSILSTLIGGIISLTVFSFSMVMVLLNQASSNFSPRILPGLISDKRNQIVLGIYIGTIIYNILVLISILPNGDSYTLNGFSILIGITFGIVCLGLFVFFIHSISTSIQINNILKSIFDNTRVTLEKARRHNNKNTLEYNVKFDQSTAVRLSESGYLEKMDINALTNWVRENALDLEVLAYEGEYLLPFQKIARVNKHLENVKLLELKSKFALSPNPNHKDNYILGIKQITEVGIKAMSPGINDPGTALITLDYLTELLSLRMKIKSHDFITTKDKQHSVSLHTMRFSTLLHQVLSTYRQYCKHDILLMRKIALMLKYLIEQEAIDSDFYTAIKFELDLTLEDVKTNIQNSFDKEDLVSLIEKIKEEHHN